MVGVPEGVTLSVGAAVAVWVGAGLVAHGLLTVGVSEMTGVAIGVDVSVVGSS